MEEHTKELERDYRQYLQDVSTDENFDITTVENWDEWLEEELEISKEIQ